MINKKSKFLFIVTILLAHVCISQQTTPPLDPKWVGQAIYLEEGHPIELENKKAHLKTNASASLYIFGLGKVKFKYVVEGSSSKTRIKARENLRFIVNAGANDINPNSVTKIVQLSTKPKKQERYYVTAVSGVYTATISGKLDLIPFQAKKYGSKSYEINIPNIEQGEYALIIGNSLDWGLFGID